MSTWHLRLKRCLSRGLFLGNELNEVPDPGSANIDSTDTDCAVSNTKCPSGSTIIPSKRTSGAGFIQSVRPPDLRGTSEGGLQDNESEITFFATLMTSEANSALLKSV